MMPIAHYQALGRKLDEARDTGDAKSVTDLESQLRKAPVVIRYVYVGDVRPPLPPEAPSVPAELLAGFLNQVCPGRAVRAEPAPPYAAQEAASRSTQPTSPAVGRGLTTMVPSARSHTDDYQQQILTLAARLVGRYDAEAVAQQALQSFAKRLETGHARGATAPEQLWKLMCKITVLRSYHHLCRRQPSKQRAAGDVLSPTETLDRAHDSLSPALRIAYVLQRYYGYEDKDFQELLHLPERQGRVLAERANRVLKRAMETKL